MHVCPQKYAVRICRSWETFPSSSFDCALVSVSQQSVKANIAWDFWAACLALYLLRQSKKHDKWFMTFDDDAYATAVETNCALSDEVAFFHLSLCPSIYCFALVKHILPLSLVAYFLDASDLQMWNGSDRHRWRATRNDGLKISSYSRWQFVLIVTPHSSINQLGPCCDIRYRRWHGTWPHWTIQQLVDGFQVEKKKSPVAQ
jgi:hypothetical protein